MHFCNHSKETCDVHLITQEKLPYTICKSGIYKLCSDLKFKTRQNGTAAITVKEGVTDVVIDFAEYALRMSSRSTTSDNFGILLKSNAKNVVIENGTIEGFSASQIRGYTNLDTIVVRNMILQGISQEKGGQRLVNEVISSGINIGPVVEIQDFVPHPELASNNVTISNVNISNFYLNNFTIPDQTVWGVTFFYVNNAQLEKVVVTDLTNNGLLQAPGGNATLAFGFYLSTNLTNRFCVGSDLTSLAPNFQGDVTGDAAGVNYLVCDGVEITDSVFKNNLGTRRGEGVVWIGTSNFVAQGCVSDNNRVVDPAAVGVQSNYGFESVGAPFGPFPPCKRGVIKNCQVLNQPVGFGTLGTEDVIHEDCEAIAGNLPQISTALVVGFQSSTSNGVTYKNCKATGFFVPVPSTLGGFRINASGNVNILNCKATKNSNGIRITASSSRVVADSNELAFNTTTGILDTVVGQTNNLYIRNVAYSNPVNYQVATSNPSFKVVQANQAAAFPLYTAVNASPLSNFDIQP
jgi:parallel beta-helix repeat protein